jgi:hypothetical protein
VLEVLDKLVADSSGAIGIRFFNFRYRSNNNYFMLVVEAVEDYLLLLGAGGSGGGGGKSDGYRSLQITGSYS